MARSEQEITEGYFPVVIGDRTVKLRELPYGEARAWSRASAEAFGPVFASFEREWQPGDGLQPIEVASDQAMETVVDSLLRYDVDGVLGGRDGIERMSSSSIVRLYREVYAEAHPFDSELRDALLRMAVTRAATLSGGANSGNGSSSIGASPRAMRRAASRRRSSTCSGNGVRSGSRHASAPHFKPPSGPASMPS